MPARTGGRAAGHQQALDQLRQIAAESDGAVEILRVAAGSGAAGLLDIELSLDCARVPHAPGGLRLRARERVVVQVPSDFPFRIPHAAVSHRRFAGAPHVQWGRWLCLYRSPATEWAPGDGMFGFLQRLLEWYGRAALGTLDAPGQPLHPPVAYASAEAGCVVVHADAPRAAVAGAPWLGVAVLRQAGPRRVDVLGWLGIGQAWPAEVTAARALAQQLHPLPEDADRGASGPARRDAVLLGLAVVLPSPTAFEFPATADTLADALTAQGVPREVFLGLLGLVALYNEPLAAQLPAPPIDAPTSDGAGRDATGGDHREPAGPRRALPLYAFIGSPARGVVGATERATHLAAWRLPELGEQVASLLYLRDSRDPELARIGQQVTAIAAGWLRQSRTAWATVFEQRPEIVTRRDAASPAAWLRDRRVLVLGAGALGAPIAEHCARAGAARVTVVDSGLVHPGVLVRQPYDGADIGTPKATALAERLRRIRPDPTVIPQVQDALDGVLRDGAGVPPADLIVDATANATVTARLEHCRQAARSAWPPTVTVLVGHDAQRGVAALALPGATGAGADILRRLGVTARIDPTGRLDDVADDLFPHPPRTELFQPEPGCSEPTFTGSAAEVAALAAHHAGRRVEPMSAYVVRLGARLDRPALPPTRLGWPNDLVARDPASGYEVRLSAAALAEMRAECRRGARLRGREVETGGLLLGQIDDACRVVWVTVASGPPPDSRLSSRHFEHGLAGVEGLIAHHDQATAGAVRFVGMWHSHPNGAAAPSPTDQQGMAELLVPAWRAPRRALLLILGGPPSRWSAWLHGRGEPDVFVRLLPGGRPPAAGPAHPRAAPASIGDWWPGGYTLRQPQAPASQRERARHRLLRRLRDRVRRARPRNVLLPGERTPAPVDPHPDPATGPSGTRLVGQEADP